MPIRSTTALALSLTVAAALGLGSAAAQTAMPPTAMPQTGMPQTGMPMSHADHAAHHGGASMPATAGALPTMPGQDAFGTIQEIVHILEADPATDWSKVDIEALRQHLIDMNEVTLNATVAATPVEGGARYEVGGAGRTGEAIRRMVPAHAHEIDGVNGWTVRAEPSATGATLTVTAADPAQTARIRGLGFIGIMAQGNHHPAHHLAMARGGFSH